MKFYNESIYTSLLYIAKFKDFNYSAVFNFKQTGSKTVAINHFVVKLYTPPF